VLTEESSALAKFAARVTLPAAPKFQETKAMAKQTKPAPNQAKPPKPTTQRDKLDVERADAEGMAQPQGKKPTKKAAPKKAPKRK
jgi:hypothetical protein